MSRSKVILPNILHPKDGRGFPPAALQWPEGYRIAVCAFDVAGNLANVLAYVRGNKRAAAERKVWEALPHVEGVFVDLVTRDRSGVEAWPVRCKRPAGVPS